MSISALTFLILTLLTLAVDMLFITESMSLDVVTKGACGVFACLFVVALVIGRRIKFDPILRQAKP